MQTDKIVDFNYLQDRTKKHYTKEEKEKRKLNQIQIGDPVYKQPSSLRGNKIAIKKWKEITGYYKKANLSITSSSDTAAIARYCLLFSDYQTIIENPVPYPKKHPRKDSSDNMEWVRYNNIKLKMANDLLRLENNLFLTPLSKYKNIPMLIKKEKKDDLATLGFDI